MKKRLAGLLAAGLLGAMVCTSMTAYADGSKVVTLGADLTEEQRTAILRYFGVLGQNIETLYITNQDERNHLGSYIPLEQIGTRTFSCALVNPTLSGGIQVKTANLNYVTGNMIASTLSTCGVVNCEVLAASPFEVSGTGALTGIIMAYEDAMGTTLDTTKKDIATQELVTTTQIANQVGQAEATNIVNEIKIQVIEGQVVDPVEVEEIVDEVVDQTLTVELSQEDRALLNELANRIAQQEYNYDDVKETLERVEQNVTVNVNVETGDTNVNNQNNNTSTNNNDSSASSSSSSDVTQTQEDSILNQADASALGEDVITTTTVEEEVAEQAQEQPAEPTVEDLPAIDIFNETSEVFGGDQTDQSVEQPAPEEQPAEEPPMVIEEPVEQPAEEPPVVEEPVVEQPAEEPPAEEPPAEEPPVEEPAVEEPSVEALTFDESNVKIIPSEQADNASGLNVLRVQVAVPGLAPTSGDDGSFGVVSVTGSNINNVIDLADPSDPSNANSNIVAVRPMQADDLASNGWAGGTELFINLGDTLDTGDIDVIYIDVMNLTLAGTSETGTMMKGVLNQSVMTSTDEVGLTFDDVNSINGYTAGQTVNGHLILPDDAEDGSVIYTAYIEGNDKISFNMLDDTSFSATLNTAGTAVVTVQVSSDGGETYIPYTFKVPVIPAG